MTSVDSRVVQMDFDNKAFSKNVNQTVNDLTTLENKMQFKNAADGFSNVESASNKVTLSGIQSAVESVNSKFSVLGVVAFNVLSNIVDTAMSSGVRIIKALSLDSLISGYQEYETKLGSIQTILANTQSKGGNIGTVTAALDELNTYADKTIYNFGEMARNIGTFTAAGVGLETSVSAIKGIANLAAVSGSNSQQASVAMYQLSQALATGTVRLMDWNSVVNAGMGGQVFQDALNETARAHGVAVDDIIAKQGSFRDSLQEGWLSAEIMTDTLDKFTMTTSDYNKEVLLSKGYTEEQAIEIMKLGDTATSAATQVKSFTQLIDTTKEALGSGWAQSWEIVFGNMEEAKTLWTGVSNVLNDMVEESANARNSLLKVWKDTGGREAIIAGLTNVFTGLLSILDKVKEAFTKVFPPMTGQQLSDLSKKFQEITEKFKIGEDSLNSIGDGFVKFFTVIKSVSTVVGSVLSGAFKILQSILSVIGTALSYVLVLFGSFGSSVADGAPALESFSQVIGTVSDKISEFLRNLSSGMPSVESFSSDIEKIKTVMQEFASSISSKIPDVLNAIGDGFKKMSEWAGKAVDVVGDFVKSIDWNVIFLGGAAAGAAIGTGSILGKIIGFLDGLKDAAENASGFVEKLSGPLESLSGILSSYQQNIKANVILKIAAAIGVLAVSLLLLSTLDAGQLAGGVGALGMLMAELTVMMSALEAIDPSGLVKTGTSLLVLSGALLILTFALKNIAELSWEEIIRGTVTLVALAGILIGLTAAMNAIKSKAVGGAVSMVIIAGALLLFGEAIKQLGAIDVNVALQGIIVMAAVLGVLTVALNLMKSSVGGAVSMLIVAAALIVLSQALSILGALPLEQLQQGGIAIATMLAVLVVAVNAMSGGLAGAAAILIISASLLVLTGVLFALGSMDAATLAQGLLGIVGVLGLFAGISLILAAFAPQVLLVSAAFAIFATGLLIASAAVVVMAIGLNMLMAAGFPALGMLALLAVALLPIVAISPLLFIAGAGLMLLGVGLVAAGAGMLLFSASSPTAITNLFLLAAAMAPLLIAAPMMIVVGAAMTILGIGAIVLGGSLVLLSLGFTMLNSSLPAGVDSLRKLGEVALEIAPATPLLIALSVCLTTLGVATLLAGAGLLVFGIGMLVASAGMAVFAAAVSGPFSDAVKIFDQAMPTFVWHTPGMLAAGAALVIFGAGALVAGAGALIAGPAFIMLAIGLRIWASAWPAAEQSFTRLVEVSTSLGPVADMLNTVNSAMSNLSGSVNAFGASITIASSGTTSLASGVMVLSSNLQSATAVTESASGTISSAMSSMVGSVSVSVSLMANQYLLMAQTIQANMNLAAANTSTASGVMVAIMNSLVVAINRSVDQIGNEFARIGPSVASGMITAIPIAEQSGRNIVYGCINGMGSLMTEVYERGAEIGRKAVQGVNDGAGNASPSKKTTKSGRYIDQGAINGMVQLAGKVYSTGMYVGTRAADAIEHGFGTLDQSSFANASFSPTVTPVMDLQQIQNGSNLRKMVASDGMGIRVDANYVSGSVDNLAQVITANQDSIIASNKEVVTALTELRSDLSEVLNQDLSDVGVYIDGRELVSSTARFTNAQLGKIARRGVV